MYHWRFIPLETRNGFWNMALDEALLNSIVERKSPNTLRFYKWNPSTASIGRNQSLTAEIDMDFAKKEGFGVVRRITGGGAVFHDSQGEITYSIICSIKFLEDLKAVTILDQFEIITKGIIEALTLYGLDSKKGIVHCPALFLDGKKFSGNAQVRRKGYLLQHGTVLLEIDPELMYSILKAPVNVKKSRMVQSVRAKCIGIRDQLKRYDEYNFIKSLKDGFEKILNIKLEEGYFSDYELKLAKRLVEEKYSNLKWLLKYE
jgi:lipoate-protein ligase A